MSSIFSKIAAKTRNTPPIFSRWPKWARWTTLAIILVVIGSGVFIIIQKSQASSATTQEAALQTATARQGSLVLQASGTGYLVAAAEEDVSFETSGKITALYVKLGDQVETGQLLAELNDSDQQAALDNAEHNLLEMTSAEAIANARLDITTAQKNLINAQIAVNNLQYWQNDALIENYHANYLLAKGRLDQAQEAYDQAAVGEFLNNSQEAQAYQTLYAAQQAFKNAEFYYSVYSQKPSQRQVDEADANLALAEAKLTEAQNYLAAITGEDVPEDATGSSLEQLRQAKLAIQTAQENLEATKLYAPISGIVMSLNAKVGQNASGVILTIDDLSQANVQFYMDASDWTNVKVGYQVSASFDALPNQTFSGTVTEVMPGLISVQGSSMVQGTALLENSVDEIGLPVGVEVALDVISGQANNAVLVPVEALHEISAGKYTLFVVENGKPMLRSVEVGLMSDTFAEITSGLQAGEIVTTGIVETQQ